MATVLVVDDDRDTADLYTALLTRSGHTVLVAYSLRGAVEHVSTYKGTIDVLLTDLHLGDGMGTELTHIMGKMAPKSVILVTGKDTFPSARHPGFEDYLVKPVDRHLLCKTVESCANLYEEESEAKVA